MQYEGWLYCDGSEYDAQDYPLLYEVIENKYGGLAGTYNIEDFGQSSSIKFNVPDYKGRKFVGAGGGVMVVDLLYQVTLSPLLVQQVVGGSFLKHNKKHCLILEIL